MKENDPDFLSWKAHVNVQEGRKNFVYLDSEGVLTLGTGHKLTALELKRYKLHDPISPALCDVMLKRDMVNAMSDARKLPLPVTLEDSEPVRWAIICDMVFNLGLPRLLKFHDFLRAVAVKDWKAAMVEMQYTDATKTTPSDWYKQVPRRVKADMKIMETGKW